MKENYATKLRHNILAAFRLCLVDVLFFSGVGGVLGDGEEEGGSPCAHFFFFFLRLFFEQGGSTEHSNVHVCL
jgi:hypothetical protein